MTAVDVLELLEEIEAIRDKVLKTYSTRSYGDPLGTSLWEAWSRLNGAVKDLEKAAGRLALAELRPTVDALRAL